MIVKNSIACRTIFNWRFYIGLPLLLLSLLLALTLEVISAPCKFTYKLTKKWSEAINYSKSLKKLTNWTFKK